MTTITERLQLWETMTITAESGVEYVALGRIYEDLSEDELDAITGEPFTGFPGDDYYNLIAKTWVRMERLIRVAHAR